MGKELPLSSVRLWGWTNSFKHTQMHKHPQLLHQDPCTLQLPEASIQDGVETDVGGAVTQPACPLHTLG